MLSSHFPERGGRHRNPIHKISIQPTQEARIRIVSLNHELQNAGERQVRVGLHMTVVPAFVVQLFEEEFYSQFNIPADTPVETPLKDLEKVNPDFSVGDVRTWLTERMNR